MRVLIISDIHANLVALEAVLADAGACDAAWCLGDLVGYGPDPNECVERVRALPQLRCLVGNHDKAVLDEIDLGVFNSDARSAVRWTRSVMTPAGLDYLRGLPAHDRCGRYSLAHGSPRQPVWEYILDCRVAQDNFPLIVTPYCLVGHTHTPVVFHEGPVGQCREGPPAYGEPFPLAGQRLILNPGSVGQPRDSLPDAAYALLDLDDDVWEFRRVAYDIAETQRRMRAAGLPERLTQRLSFGW
jgi:diadenosine tetraphosphatase ApaH/serine/threonine PP2A family protein phosphatase